MHKIISFCEKNAAQKLLYERMDTLSIPITGASNGGHQSPTQSPAATEWATSILDDVEEKEPEPIPEVSDEVYERYSSGAGRYGDTYLQEKLQEIVARPRLFEKKKVHGQTKKRSIRNRIPL